MNDANEVTALIIWWCEGTKARRDRRWKNSVLCPIEVTNTDWRIIKIFADFLIKHHNVSRALFKGQLQIHDGDDQSKIEHFWLDKLGLNPNQLNKTIIRPLGNKPGKSMGTFKLRLYDKALYSKLLTQLNGIIGFVLD